MKPTWTWTCPACDEVVPIDGALITTDHQQNALVVRIPDEALVDVHAHAWIHT